MAESGEGGRRPEDEGLGETARSMRAAQPYIDAVSKLLSGALLGVGGGYLLDRWLGTSPWLMLALSVVGISVGFYGFVVALMKLSKRR